MNSRSSGGGVTDLSGYYTMTEVDQIVADIDIPVIDHSNLLAKDEDNKVSSEFRIASSVSNDTFISCADNKLGLSNLKPPEKAHHAISKGYADDGDRETLQKAKDYADSIEPTLDDYYNKDVPDPGSRWTDYWSTRNMRVTSIRATPHSSTMLDRENIEDALKRVLAVADDVIHTLWSDLDADGSGAVDRDEALHWYVFPALT